MGKTDKSENRLETIVMCIKSHSSEMCIKECPVYKNCWPDAYNKPGYRKAHKS